MLKFYRILKIIFLIFLLLTLSSILIYENIKDMNLSFKISPFFQDRINDYISLKSFILDDPYNKNILSKIEQSKNKFNNLFAALNTGLSNLTTEKYFYNNIFIYMVSKRMDDMDHMVNSILARLPSFKDLIIIDKDKNILYKYGNSAFTAEYFPINKNSEYLFIDNDLGVIKRYNDPTIDYELEVIALFDHNSIIRYLKELDIPAFFVMNNKIYKNSYPLPGIFSRIQKDLQNERKYYMGINVVETSAVTIDGFYIGTLGLTYSSRSLGSTLLIMMKFIIFLILVTLIFTIDNIFEAKLKNRANTIKKKVLKISQDQNEAGVMENDANLEWISHYIQDAEGKK